MDAIQQVANNPDTPPVLQDNDNYLTTGTVDGVTLDVAVRPNGTVATGYPTAGAGVCVNDENGDPQPLPNQNGDVEQAEQQAQNESEDQVGTHAETQVQQAQAQAQAEAEAEAQAEAEAEAEAMAEAEILGMMGEMNEQPQRDARGKLILSPEMRARMLAQARQLSADCRALLDQLGDRLPADVLAQLEKFSFVGEWELLIDELAATLMKRRIPVTVVERDLLRLILYSFGPVTTAGNSYIADRDNVMTALEVTDADPE
ncbi:MAG TPA: hypothetical protein VG756_26165 [Pseudonocardiaceae bacterium]|jgi:hypothetical protein|nr:hypothetical protein [Pseudonocardiaceae bacterium]